MAITTELTTAGRGEVRIAPPALLSDEALAARVRRGDERAFEALYHRYRDPLHRYCASILRQPEDAEEALQSVMVAAFRSLAGTEPRSLKVRPWLYRIAHNQCVGMLRRRPGHRAEALTGSEPSPSPGPAERLLAGEELARLREDLLALPADQRGALVMRELAGMSHGQIAEALGESAASVKQLIYQARTALHGMADGRGLDCHEVRRRVSDGDGRVLRSRSIGAHLRACEGCRIFREATSVRPGQLAALAPALPMGGADRILEAVLGLSGGLGGGGGGALIGAGAGAGAAVGGGLPALGGGIGAKLAAVATAGVLGGSVIAIPVAADSARQPSPTRPAATAAGASLAPSAGGSVAPGVTPATVLARPRGPRPAAPPAEAVAARPADGGAPARAAPGPAGPEPGGSARIVAVPTVPPRVAGHSGRAVAAIGATGPRPAPTSRRPLPVPAAERPPSIPAPEPPAALGRLADPPGVPASAPRPAPPVPLPGTGPSAQPRPDLPAVPDPSLPGTALAP